MSINKTLSGINVGIIILTVLVGFFSINFMAPYRIAGSRTATEKLP